MEANNMKAMREALEAINRIDTRRLKRLLCELVEADIFDGGLINKTISYVDKARAALAAPPRNCDVGTAEDWERRFMEFCKSHPFDCPKCPLNTMDNASCLALYLQMPYGKERLNDAK